MEYTKLRDEHGQSLILIALAMIALLAFLGLLLDGGEAYLSRRDAQDAADAGAFAGARVLALHDSNSTPSNIQQAINTFASANQVVSTTQDVTAYFIKANGSLSSICVTTIGTCSSTPSDATGVAVTATFRFNPAFMGVINAGGRVSIPALAKVQSGPPGGASNIFPLTIITQTFSYTQVYTFTSSSNGSTFGWLSFDCIPDSPDLVAYINQTKSSGVVDADPNDPCASNPCTATEWNNTDPLSRVCAGPGVKADSQIQAALDKWVNKPVTIPIYDGTNGANGSGLAYHIVAFAEFILSSYNFHGQTKWVSGTFSKFTQGFVGHPGACNVNGVICAVSLVP